MAVWEVAQLAVPDADREKFRSIFQEHLPLMRDDEGCLDVKLLEPVEREGLVLVWILWKSQEYHTQVFTKTEGFAKFIGAITPFFTAPAQSFHATVAIDGF